MKKPIVKKIEPNFAGSLFRMEEVTVGAGGLKIECPYQVKCLVGLTDQPPKPLSDYPEGIVATKKDAYKTCRIYCFSKGTTEAIFGFASIPSHDKEMGMDVDVNVPFQYKLKCASMRDRQLTDFMNGLGINVNNMTADRLKEKFNPVVEACIKSVVGAALGQHSLAQVQAQTDELTNKICEMMETKSPGNNRPYDVGLEMTEFALVGINYNYEDEQVKRRLQQNVKLAQEIKKLD